MSDLLFDFPKYKIDKDIRLIELFAGVGSQMMSLRNLKNKGVIKQNLESYKVVEFDKYAIASYNAIHGTDFPTMDITKIHADDLEIKDCDKYTYIMTYSFPCTDLSLAGKQMGMKKGSGTRSGLLWEVERLLNEAQNLPQVLLMENVPQVHADVNIDDFNSWIRFLRSKGYINFYKDLNAKDYGVAQNRERCFMISFLSDEFQDYEFPVTQKLTKTVRDYLEEEVDEKYYINNEKAMKLIQDLAERNSLPAIEKYGNDKAVYEPFDKAISYPLHSQDFIRTGFMEIAPTMAARDFKDPKIITEKNRVITDRQTDRQTDRLA